MAVHVLNDEQSLVNHYLHVLRDVELQQNRERFEATVERLGMIAGYEASKLLDYIDHETTTPLGTANTPLITDKIVLATILRAGLPLQRGVQRILPDAEISFIAAARKQETSAGVEIELSYVATPRLENKTLLIADTMLATGNSLVDTYAALTATYGQPRRTIIIAVIASKPGAAFVSAQIPKCDIVTCALDAELNDNFYIVPGLGDAGDLLYGPKA